MHKRRPIDPVVHDDPTKRVWRDLTARRRFSADVLLMGRRIDEELAANKRAMEARPLLLEQQAHDKASALGLLALQMDLLSDVQTTAHQMALSAHEFGASWREIGDAIGVSGQTAYQRWSDRGRAHHAAGARRRSARISPLTDENVTTA